MWADAKRDGRSAEYRWRPEPISAAKWAEVRHMWGHAEEILLLKVFSEREHVHVRYMLSPVRLSSVCLSVACLSVTLMHPT